MKYPIGVWYQPADLFASWKGDGINTIVGCPVDLTTPPVAIMNAVSAWCAACAAANLDFWLQSSLLVRSTAWVAMPNCVGVLLEPDEPNGGGAQSPAQMAGIAKSARIYTDKPLMLDFDGAAIAFQPDDSMLAAYCAPVDVVCSDYYFYNRAGDRPSNQNGLNIDRIRRLAPGKRIFGVPECNDQGLRYSGYFSNGRGPTGAELAAILSEMQQHKADGTIFFSDVFGLKGTPPLYQWIDWGYASITADCRATMQAYATTMNPGSPRPTPTPLPPPSPTNPPCMTCVCGRKYVYSGN